MYRCLLALLIALACSALWAAPPTEAEIQQAVKDLADKRFTVREKASKTLWQAGSAAEPALKEAQHSKDPETARRARAILDKFEFGIFPDTPKELAALIDEYRSADKEGRKAAVGKIMALGKVGFGTIRRLADKESPADKPAIFAQITHDAPRGVARSLVEGDLAFTEELLDMCLSSDTDEAATNYAAFHYLRGSLDAAIKRWQAEWQAGKPNPLRPRAGDVLVHLYRAKGDFAAARKIAGQMSGDSLLEQLLWEQGDWKALAAMQNADSREPL